MPITPASTTPRLARLRGRLVSHSGASSPFFYGFDPNEAQGWVPSRVKGGAAHVINTKSKRRRSIPIPPELEARILQHFKAYGLFTNCRNAFDEAVDKAGLRLPAGQEAHVLRHTFASHFMANGGYILSLH